MKRLSLLSVVLLTLAGCQANGGKGLSALPFPGRKAQPAAVADRGPKAGEQESAERGSFVLRLAEGRNLEKVGQWDEARRVYKRLMEDFPDRAEVYHRLAVVADRQRRHDEAQRLYTRAVRLSPGDGELFNDLGYCFYLQGKLTKAQSALEKAVRLEPENARYRNNLGMVLGQQEKYEEALQEFQATASDADAYYNLAFVYASQDKNDQAKVCFRRALQLDPTHDQAREALVAFEQYEDRADLVPEELAELGESAGDVAYVPYQEGSAGAGEAVAGGSSGNAVAPAAHDRPASLDAAGSIAPSGGWQARQGDVLLPAQRRAGTSVRALHEEAKGLLQRRFASARQDEMAADEQP